VDKERNLRLYHLLKEKLGTCRDDAKKAFAEPIFMPVNDLNTTKAPRIKSVRIVTSEKSGIEINKGFASNGGMKRIDVFRQDGQFHLVPIYVHHFTKTGLPSRAIAVSKPEEQWTVMDDTNFLFCLQKNDYVVLRDKERQIEGYYIMCDRSNGRITIKSHDGDPNFGANGEARISTKTLKDIQKYSVDFFGNKTRIVKEIRLGLANDSDSEPG
jgi:CRISPR-associated endonuclease Csn1